MRAKICGITRQSDANSAVSHGAWALGFNFYEKSPRYIAPSSAHPIIKALPKDIVKVGVFVSCSLDFIVQTLDTLSLDFAQIYNDVQAPGHLKRKMILSLHAKTENDLPEEGVLKGYGALLLDASVAADGLLGGTGRVCNWNLANKLAQQYPLLLAGGLNPNNVAYAIKMVAPYAVDVASGIESTPGIKDPSLLKLFLQECQHEQ